MEIISESTTKIMLTDGSGWFDTADAIETYTGMTDEGIGIGEMFILESGLTILSYIDDRKGSQIVEKIDKDTAIKWLLNNGYYSEYYAEELEKYRLK